MKILIVPNEFKQSLNAINVAKAIKSGLEKTYPNIEYDLIPIADGGDGTSIILTKAVNGKIVYKKVEGPFFKEVKSKYGIDLKNKTAFIECAEACGMKKVGIDELNPLLATSFGVGKLVLDSINKGCKKIVLCIGGTCTNDGGIGILSAFGIKFLDENNSELLPIGKNLIKIKKIDITKLDKRLENVEFILANDVKNYLLGDNGATKIYGPQKGASLEMIDILERGLKNLASIIYQKTKIDITTIEGGGSGGGIGASLFAFLKVKSMMGFEIIKEYTNIEEKIKQSDIVITGEGKIDEQTSFGKAPLQVAMLAKKYDKTVLAFVGINNSCGTKYIDKCYSLLKKDEVYNESMKKNTYANLKKLASSVLINDLEFN